MPFLSGPRTRWQQLTAHGYRGFERIRLLIDMTYCRHRFGCRQFEYFWFNFMDRKDRDRKNFLLLHHQSVGYKAVKRNKTPFVYKSQQYELFPDMIGREYIKVGDGGFEALADFVAKREKVIFKPNHGTHGNGIFTYKASEGTDRLEEIYNDICDKNYLCEDFIIQHPEMSKLSNESVNSLRVLTLNDHGNVKIIDAAVKMGADDNPFDNLSSGGLAATVDVETGIVVTKGVSSHHERFVYHPETMQKIIGFNIPMWEELKSMVTEAAKRMPDMPIRGWDIAVSENGPCIIEVNSYPGSRLNQLMDQKPKGKEIIEYINKNSTASQRRKIARARRKNKRRKNNGK